MDFFVLFLMIILPFCFSIRQPQNTREKSVFWQTNVPKCPPCSCGIGSFSTRVVGGIPSWSELHPWLVALVDLRTGKRFCSATIISDSFAVTAAHCLRGMHSKNILASLLDTERRISNMLTHPEFNKRLRLNNDIALLKFNFPVNFLTSLTTPACLPSHDFNDIDRTASIVGWGRTAENQITPKLLHEATVPTLKPELCRMLQGYRNITENMLCAGYIKGGIDACQGDSGGPLMIQEKDRNILTGIVSWGIGCARPMKPGVYTRMKKITRWIRNRTKNSCFCY